MYHSPPFRDKYSSFTVAYPGACIQGLSNSLTGGRGDGVDIGQDYANAMKVEVGWLCILFLFLHYGCFGRFVSRQLFFVAH